MIVGLAQLNPVVGDIEGNLKKIEDTLAQYSPCGVDLLIFPELFITGYPPRDLLEKPWFLKKVEKSVTRLRQLSLRYPGTGILIGLPVPTDGTVGRGLYNGAILIYQGREIGRTAKTLLPIYDVFDEERYFDPAPRVETVPFKGEVLGVSICEDAWNDPELWPSRRMYSFDPIEALAKQGATLLVNISASPFTVGKEEIRYRLIRNHARRHNIPFIYVNQVGGNDELVFDGRSMAFNRRGELLYLGAPFKEEIGIIDTEKETDTFLYSSQDRIQSVFEALVLGTRDYLKKCGFKKAVIGLSGGIDSAVTCCIAVEALGRENVLGISMPSPYSSAGSVTDSQKLASNLGIQFLVIPITQVFESYLTIFDGFLEGRRLDIAEENLQARIRGNILMAFANRFGYLVLSTGNKSELAVGYCTLYGDMSGGLSVLADVPKTMVYDLAGYINRSKEIIPLEIIHKAPSAELRPGQTDQDTLPPYPLLDQILYLYVEENLGVEEIVQLGLDEDTVKKVVRSVNASEYKRRQAAPGLKVTSKAFGMGRRMPIAARIEV
ncbi:MAG TPA: NAD+ synthase [Syntrophothermus lipocalidus]|uniref:Glutamine-dependent NAD(+) synthetase n=1 Tax=Syntrophothermus lipocalidus (strain DSM 12680 / TGB-C1) TaxID=643648 RepID=D7CNP7_SYNLT|nr:NAD+ synthase [Syntrophothermus lipocalidus]ADI02332.1 NAD+ synthetase [Syntrophothermus lipocalidus DSM 12680]HHV76861.1 NAD+ synthase [Syntrophothermus lipocalidus]